MVAMNIGGTVHLKGDVSVTMVQAVSVLAHRHM